MKSLAATAGIVLTALVAATVIVGAGQDPQQQVPPIFRTQVDVIQLDVSVLDKDRRPVRGLKQSEFTVLENGKPQRIVAITEIDAAERDPAQSAWMRHVGRDVTMNDLNDMVGDGHLYAIVLDDRNIPWDNLDIIQSTRSLAHYILNSLGPSDQAAVVYTQDAGRGEDFTDDRLRLAAAIDRLEPHPPDWVYQLPSMGPSGGDMPQRFSPVLNRTACQRTQPAVPTLDTVTAQLGSVPKRRKTIFFISPGVPVDFGARTGCQQVLAEEMKDVFRLAQRANVNIYGIDPGGFRGYEMYLYERMTKVNNQPAMAATASARNGAQLLHDFLNITAENTGARAIVSTDELEAEVERVFDEDSSYYLIGYQTSNTQTDGKFRKTEVKVSRPGVTIRNRSGYWGVKDRTFASTEKGDSAPGTVDLGLAGLASGPGVPLRAVATPIAIAGTDATGRNAAVAVVLTVRTPAPRQPVQELLTLVTNLYDADGKTSKPQQRNIPMTLNPGPGEELRYDVGSRFDLLPGRYQIRLNAHSKVLDKSSTVYADVDVPDFRNAAFSVSGLVLGTEPSGPRTDGLEALLPIVPTTARDFAPVEHVFVFLRAFQGGSEPPVPVTLAIQVLDNHDKTKFESKETIGPDKFGGDRSAPFQFELPLSKLDHGPHLLSIRADMPGGTSIRRDLVFRVR
jgi:VWFA-related protein